MERAYKFRIYPNKTQECLLQKTFGCVRFIYNHFLDRRIKAYEQNKKTISYNECSKELTQLKKEKKWLKEPDKSSLQNALKNLDTAYKNFFNRQKAGFPKNPMLLFVIFVLYDLYRFFLDLNLGKPAFCLLKKFL